MQYQREEEARLIHQLFQSEMVKLGYGNFIFDWDYMPADARKAWVECVSTIFNARYRSMLNILKDQFHVC